MIYERLLRPLLFALDPETAHHFALAFLRATGPLLPKSTGTTSPVSAFGLNFRHRVGLAAGLDKNGVALPAWEALGFSFVEIGTVTAQAQPGNPRPRIFRYPNERALINRLGFNNAGAKAAVRNLKQHRPDCVLGVNIGKARKVPIDKAIPDYLKTFAAIYDVADYVAVNVSSPNTPQLRDLQQPEMLADLLGALQARNRELAGESSHSSKPILLKISPDLTEAQIESIVEVALHAKVAGIIATNTTVDRPDLRSASSRVEACGEGGLSGAPLAHRSNEIIALIYRLTNGSLPIIGVGGVFTAEDAWEKIRAGACLVQIYTGFIYEGPGVVRRINEGLRRLLTKEGFVSLDEAVGSRALATSA